MLNGLGFICIINWNKLTGSCKRGWVKTIPTFSRRTEEKPLQMTLCPQKHHKRESTWHYSTSHFTLHSFIPNHMLLCGEENYRCVNGYGLGQYIAVIRKNSTNKQRLY
jgi:hypothetical protein